MTRFFVRPEQIVGTIVTLEADDAAHLAKVLRAQVGHEIAVIDGSGTQRIARLAEIDKHRVRAEVIRTEALDTEPKVAVTIVQSLPKTAERLDWVLQHAVEIGAAEFVLFRSRRSEAGRLAERPDRWAKIVKTAAEQSGRARLPGVRQAVAMVGAMDAVRGCELVLLCDETETARSLRAALSGFRGRSAALLIGPEGGWSPEERDTAVAAGAVAVGLGPRILRTETAALSALSQLLYAVDAD